MPKKCNRFYRIIRQQIVEVFKKEGDVCGRFLKSQLERDLIIPKEKNRLWMAASAAVVAFLGLGSGKVFAQTDKAKTVQVEKVNVKSNTTPSGATRLITGTVIDDTGLAIPGVKVVNICTGKSVQTDFDGLFSISANNRDVLELSFIALEAISIDVDDRNDYPVLMKNSSLDEVIYVGGANSIEAYPKRLTFFGSIFHRIGNIFRKKEG